MARLSSEVKQSIVSAAGADFILVELRDGDAFPVYDFRGDLLKFRSGAEANTHAMRLSQERGNKVQPRRVNDTNWRDRERTKLKDGTYRPLPWVGKEWWEGLAEIHADHFPHVSVQKQALIAFTESEEKGSADIQAVIKPGKYFEKFFGDKIGEHMIRDLCTIFAAKFEVNEVLFAETADEIEEVYTTGPSSCMSKGPSSYPTAGYHPVRAYAAGDLQVAYITREGGIKARTVVWPSKKLYSPYMYGDKGRLEPMLKKLGFKAGPMTGAKLAKVSVPEKGREAKGMHVFVVPHVDGSGAVEVLPDHLLITAKSQNEPHVLVFSGGTGITEPYGIKCEKCKEDDYRSRDMANVYGKDDGPHLWCKSCQTTHTVYCQESGSTVDKVHVIEIDLPKGFVWSRYAKRIIPCVGTGIRMLESHAISVGGKFYSPDYFKKVGERCPECRARRLKGAKCSECGAV